jgi:hypothetical protein
VLERVLGRRVGLLLQVRGDDERGRRPGRERGAHGAVQRVRQLLGHVHLDEVLAGHVLEQRLQVDLLLVGAAHRAARRLADDRDHRHVVEFRVVEAVQQVDRARAGGGQAHADLAAELRVADGCERGHLLVPGLHEPRPVVGLPEAHHDSVDAVTRIGEDLFDTPLAQSLEQVVADRRTHTVLLLLNPRSEPSTHDLPANTAP